jgi:hypothetical protein
MKNLISNKISKSSSLTLLVVYFLITINSINILVTNVNSVEITETEMYRNYNHNYNRLKNRSKFNTVFFSSENENEGENEFNSNYVVKFKKMPVHSKFIFNMKENNAGNDNVNNYRNNSGMNLRENKDLFKSIPYKSDLHINKYTKTPKLTSRLKLDMSTYDRKKGEGDKKDKGTKDAGKEGAGKDDIVKVDVVVKLEDIKKEIIDEVEKKEADSKLQEKNGVKTEKKSEIVGNKKVEVEIETKTMLEETPENNTDLQSYYPYVKTEKYLAHQNNDTHDSMNPPIAVFQPQIQTQTQYQNPIQIPNNNQMQNQNQIQNQNQNQNKSMTFVQPPNQNNINAINKPSMISNQTPYINNQTPNTNNPLQNQNQIPQTNKMQNMNPLSTSSTSIPYTDLNTNLYDITSPMFHDQHHNNDNLQNKINELNNNNIKNYVHNINMPHQPKTLSSIIRDGIANHSVLNNSTPNYNPYLSSSPYTQILDSNLSNINNNNNDITKIINKDVVKEISNPIFSSFSPLPFIREGEESILKKPVIKDSKTTIINSDLAHHLDKQGLLNVVNESSKCLCFKNFNCPSCDNSELILKLSGYYNNCPCARQYCKPCINSSKIHELSLLKSFNDKKVLDFLRKNSEIMNQGIVNVSKTLDRVIQYENEALKASKNLEETKLKAFIARAKMNTNSEKARTIARDTLFSKSFINIKDAGAAQNFYNQISSKITDFPNNMIIEDNNTNTSNSLKSIEHSNGYNDITKPPNFISDNPYFINYRKKYQKGDEKATRINNDYNNLDADFNTIKNYDFSNSFMKNNNKSNFRKNSENLSNDDSNNNNNNEDPLSKTMRKNLQNDEALKSINELNKIIFEGAEMPSSTSQSSNKISDELNNNDKSSLGNLNNSNESFTPEEVKSINDIVSDIKSVKSNSFSTNYAKDEDKNVQNNQKNELNNKDETKSSGNYTLEDDEDSKSNEKITNESNKPIVQELKQKRTIQKFDKSDESEDDDFKKEDQEDDYEDNDDYDDPKPTLVEKRSTKLTKGRNKSEPSSSSNKNNNKPVVRKNSDSKSKNSKNRKNTKISKINKRKYN